MNGGKGGSVTLDRTEYSSGVEDCVRLARFLHEREKGFSNYRIAHQQIVKILLIPCGYQDRLGVPQGSQNTGNGIIFLGRELGALARKRGSSGGRRVSCKGLTPSLGCTDPWEDVARLTRDQLPP